MIKRAIQSQRVANHKKSERTRRKILDVSASLFSRRGYTSTSLRDIASGSRIQSGSIYYYFSSKEGILDQVMQEGLTTLHSSVQSAVDALARETTPGKRLEVAVHAHLSAVLSRSDYISTNVKEFDRAPKSVRSRNLKLRQEYADYWKTLIEDAQRSGYIRSDVDISLLRLFIIGAANWSVDWYKPRKLTVSEIGGKLFEYFYQGVAPHPSHNDGKLND